ncbi:hypothetical protein KY331_03165 [Candidatus Woesearchaeota archaeon]|nr:hypothetical protein [Candidatus Woesearchaeota archaeon]
MSCAPNTLLNCPDFTAGLIVGVSICAVALLIIGFKIMYNNKKLNFTSKSEEGE